MKRFVAIFTVLVWSAIGLALSGESAHAERRVALVVGNSQYKNAALVLPNPQNDAQDMAKALTDLGFEVVTAIDATKRDMDMALQRFARLATNSDSALFYYAGHAMQYQGRNYLMPTDAELEDEVSLLYEMTAFEDVRAALDRSNGVKILILDACRNNPLAERLIKTVQGNNRALGNVRGLARIDKTQGMVVAYATAADEVAIDGTGRNSPFTKALLTRLQEPGLEIEMMFRRVAADVNAQTNGRQRPETYISLLNEYYLNQNDQIAWDKIKDADDINALRDFVTRFPASPHSLFARNRIDLLDRNAREREAQKQADEEQQRKAAAAEQEAAKQLADEKARLQQLEDLIRKQVTETLRLEAEAQKQKADADAAAQKATADAAQKAATDAAAQKAAAEAAQKQAAAEAAAQKQKADAERQRLADEAAQKQKAAEAERQRLAAEAAQKAADEAAQKQKAEAERQRLAAEAVQKAETERQRVAAEDAAKQQAEAAAKAEADRQKLAAAAAQQQVDAERQRIIDACNREEERFALLQAGGSYDEMVRFMGEVTCRSLRPLVAEAIAGKLSSQPKDGGANATVVASASNAAPTVPSSAAANAPASKPVEVAVATPPAAPTGDRTSQIRLAQRELRRLGCYSGDVTGDFSAATREAVGRYLTERHQASADTNVTDDLISKMQNEVSRVCPLTCGRGQIADGDRCIAEPRNAKPATPVARRQAPNPRPVASQPATPTPSASAVSSAKPSPMVGVGN